MSAKEKPLHEICCIHTTLEVFYFSTHLHNLLYGLFIRKNRTLRIEKHSVHLQPNRLIKVMEKEIELIRMTSTEIMEKVAAYKDEQIVILNQVNKVSETEQYFPIRADFFLAILCLRGKASLYLNNNSYEISPNDLMICHPQTLLKHGMIGDDFECCGFCLSPEYAKRIFVMSSSTGNWCSRLYLEQHPIFSLTEKESLLFCQYYNLLYSKLTGSPHRHQKELINSLLQAFIYEFQDVIEKYVQLPTSNFKSSGNLFNAFIELLVSSYPKERSVSYYANRLFVTSKYLSAVCKENSGETASDLITCYVMKDIVYLLKSPDKSIKEIANELNFATLSFFGKYVKRNLGLSPKEYREKLSQQVTLT